MTYPTEPTSERPLRSRKYLLVIDLQGGFAWNNRLHVHPNRLSVLTDVMIRSDHNIRPCVRTTGQGRALRGSNEPGAWGAAGAVLGYLLIVRRTGPNKPAVVSPRYWVGMVR
jgi:hypothetical protein